MSRQSGGCGQSNEGSKVVRRFDERRMGDLLELHRGIFVKSLLAFLHLFPRVHDPSILIPQYIRAPMLMKIVAASLAG